MDGRVKAIDLDSLSFSEKLSRILTFAPSEQPAALYDVIVSAYQAGIETHLSIVEECVKRMVKLALNKSEYGWTISLLYKQVNQYPQACGYLTRPDLRMEYQCYEESQRALLLGLEHLNKRLAKPNLDAATACFETAIKTCPRRDKISLSVRQGLRGLEEVTIKKHAAHRTLAHCYIYVGEQYFPDDLNHQRDYYIKAKDALMTLGDETIQEVAALTKMHAKRLYRHACARKTEDYDKEAKALLQESAQLGYYPAENTLGRISKKEKRLDFAWKHFENALRLIMNEHEAQPSDMKACVEDCYRTALLMGEAGIAAFTKTILAIVHEIYVANHQVRLQVIGSCRPAVTDVLEKALTQPALSAEMKAEYLYVLLIGYYLIEMTDDKKTDLKSYLTEAPIDTEKFGILLRALQYTGLQPAVKGFVEELLMVESTPLETKRELFLLLRQRYLKEPLQIECLVRFVQLAKEYWSQCHSTIDDLLGDSLCEAQAETGWARAELLKHIALQTSGADEAEQALREYERAFPGLSPAMREDVSRAYEALGVAFSEKVPTLSHRAYSLYLTDVAHGLLLPDTFKKSLEKLIAFAKNAKHGAMDLEVVHGLLSLTQGGATFFGFDIPIACRTQIKKYQAPLEQLLKALAAAAEAAAAPPSYGEALRMKETSSAPSAPPAEDAGPAAADGAVQAIQQSGGSLWDVVASVLPTVMTDAPTRYSGKTIAG